MRFARFFLLVMTLLCGMQALAQEPLVWEAAATYEHLARVTWNADSTLLATASFVYDDNLRLQSVVEVWDAATGERLKSFGTDEAQPASVVFNTAGTVLITGLTSGEMAVWNLQDGQIVQRLPAHETAPNLTLSADGQWLVSWESSGVIIWQAETLAPQIILTPESADAALPVFALISADSTTLTLVDTAGVATLYDLKTGDQVSKLLTDQTIEPYTAAYAPTTPILALGYQNLAFWDVILRTQTRTLLVGSDVYRAAYRNENQIGIADANGTVALWDIDTGLRAQTFVEGLENVSDLAFSPDGTRLAIGGTEGQIAVYAVVE